MTRTHGWRPRRTALRLGLGLSLSLAASLLPADQPEAEGNSAASLPSPDAGLEGGRDLELERLPLGDPEWPDATPGPDREGIRLLIELDPTALGPLSIGTPDAGLLFNPQPMPEGPRWTIRNPVETFGTTETIGFIVDALEAVEREFPGSPRIVIGDISRRDGGRLNRHASHQAGRDVDLGFYYRAGEMDDFCRPGRGQLDVPRTWALVRALITRSDVNRIFLDRSIQRLLRAHAVERGEDQDWLDDVFGQYDASRDAIIQHVRRHADHMHVRFYNRRAQEWGRLAYPLLVRKGLVPGPTVAHRVRRGETLSQLSRRYGTSTSAIRAANGLRGSTIRAGRKYVIPVRGIPLESEPVVIPPRRLPGSAARSVQPPGDDAGASYLPAGDGDVAAARDADPAPTDVDADATAHDKEHRAPRTSPAGSF